MPLVPLWGVWADKYSRKAVIVRSCLVEAVVFVCVALSREPWQLALSLLLIGFQLGQHRGDAGGHPRRRPGAAARDDDRDLRRRRADRVRDRAVPRRVRPRRRAGLAPVVGVLAVGRCCRSGPRALVWFGSREVRPAVVPQGRVLSLAFGAVRGVLTRSGGRRIFAIYGVAFLANQMSRPYQPLIVEEIVRQRAGLGVGDRGRRRAGGLGRRGGLRRSAAGWATGSGSGPC